MDADQIAQQTSLDHGREAQHVAEAATDRVRDCHLTSLDDMEGMVHA
ncbi:hypothetical protein [Streptomyces parvulus]